MWAELFAFVGIPVIRNVAGWLENSFKDKKIDKYEWQELFNTVLRVGILGVALWLGLGVDPLVASAGAVAVDFGISAVRKIGK